MRCSPRDRRSGVSLIEVLLALSLSVFLITATFGAIRHSVVLRHRGTDQIRESQVSIALMRDLQFDLERVASHLLEPASMGPESNTTLLSQAENWMGSVVRERVLDFETNDVSPVVLYGTSSHLALTTVGNNPRFAPFQQDGVKDHRHVVWSLGGRSSIRTVLKSSQGKIRESVLPLPKKCCGLLQLTVPVQGTESRPQVTLREVASEVSSLRLRYFDGSDWLNQWNSATFQRLPEAIEVQLAIQDSGEKHRLVIALPAPHPGGKNQ